MHKKQPSNIDVRGLWVWFMIAGVVAGGQVNPEKKIVIPFSLVRWWFLLQTGRAPRRFMGCREHPAEWASRASCAPRECRRHRTRGPDGA